MADSECDNSEKQSDKGKIPPSGNETGTTSIINLPLDENAILNEEFLMQSDEPLQIFCRVKCLGSNTSTTNVKIVSPNFLNVNVPQGDESDPWQTRQYVFSRIHSSYSTQQEIFHDTTFPLLGNLIDGFDTAILIYGGLNSGREYVTYGAFADPGIIPRCIDTLFNTIKFNQAKKFFIAANKTNTFKVLNEKQSQEARAAEQKRKVKAARSRKHIPLTKVAFINHGIYVDELNTSNFFTIFISFFQIYKNVIYDLLDETNKTPEGKVLKEDAKGEMYVGDILEVEVRTPSDAYELLSIGYRLKRVYHATLGDDFICGHSVLNIRVAQIKKGANDASTLKSSHLCIVDFCGWDKANPNCDNEDRLKEVASLQNCMQIVKSNYRDNETNPIPDNEYTLAKILNSYFKNKRRTNVLLCLNPMTQNHEEIKQTLNFSDYQGHIKVTTDLRYIKIPSPEPELIGKDERIPQQAAMLQNTSKTPENLKEEESNSIVQKTFNNVTASNQYIRYLLEVLDKHEGPLKNAPSGSLRNSFRQRLINSRRQNIVYREEMRRQRLKLKEQVNREASKKPTDDEDSSESLDQFRPCKEQFRIILDENIAADIQRQRKALEYRRRKDARKMEQVRLYGNMENLCSVQEAMQAVLQILKGQTTSSPKNMATTMVGNEELILKIIKRLPQFLITEPRFNRMFSFAQLRFIAEVLLYVHPKLAKWMRLKKKISFKCSIYKTRKSFKGRNFRK